MNREAWMDAVRRFSIEEFQTLQEVAWRNILHARDGYDPFLSIDPNVSTAGPKSLSFLENTGLVYHLANVPTAFLDEVRRQLPYGIFQAPPDPALATAPTPLQ